MAFEESNAALASELAKYPQVTELRFKPNCKRVQEITYKKNGREYFTISSPQIIAASGGILALAKNIAIGARS